MANSIKQQRLNDNLPAQIRLGELKKPLMRKAFREERTLHNYLYRILSKHVEELRKTEPDLFV